MLGSAPGQVSSHPSHRRLSQLSWCHHSYYMDTRLSLIRMLSLPSGLGISVSPRCCSQLLVLSRYYISISTRSADLKETSQQEVCHQEQQSVSNNKLSFAAPLPVCLDLVTCISNNLFMMYPTRKIGESQSRTWFKPLKTFQTTRHRQVKLNRYKGL